MLLDTVDKEPDVAQPVSVEDSRSPPPGDISAPETPADATVDVAVNIDSTQGRSITITNMSQFIRDGKYSYF